MGEKKRRLAARQPPQVRFDDRLLAQALQAIQAGNRRAAEGAFETLQAELPRDPEALHALGVLGLQLGRNERAEALLRRAVELDARQAAYRCHLAIAHRRLGKSDLAVGELEAALALDPSLPEAHSNLGMVLLERDEHDAALPCFARALALRRDFPDALNGLGGTQLALGYYEDACRNLERAIAIEPAFHEAWYNLAKARAQWAASLEGTTESESGASAAVANAERGLDSILTALAFDGRNPDYWTQFEESVRSFDLRHPVDPRVRDTLHRALDHPAVDPARLARPIISLVRTHPAAAAIERRLPGSGAFDERAWLASKDDVAVVLGDMLLQRLLADVVVPNAFVQRVVGFTRHALLRECADGQAGEPSLPLQCVAALAHQGFNTEYVNEESAAEVALLMRLQSAIAAAQEAGRPVPLHLYAIYACYRPLHTLDAADRIACDLAPTSLRSLAVRQIDEPLEEARIRPTISALSCPVDAVSAAVRSQYEANPYPRWLRVRRCVAPGSVAGFLRQRFPEADLHGLADAPARILIAGCGTGRHSVSTAQRFPDASMLAVDLSLTSLAYAVRKTRELGIRNVEYRQADILALGSAGERFDVIECSGVLHHLEDPVAGWRTLCSLLHPGGVMRVGLYSALARRHVERARALVAAEGFAATPDGIRACRSAILARHDDPLLARVARGEDFYSLSGCRDLVFHVREQSFTLPQIAAILAELDLAFIGFEIPDAGTSARFRTRFRDDRALSDLGNWAAFEADRPDTFAQMYQFWVRKPV